MNDRREDSQEAQNLEGRYANYFKIGFNAFEFLLDFGQLYDGKEKAQFHTRIITSPIYAKQLSQLLQDSILQHERTFGKISEAEDNGAESANDLSS